MSVRKRYRDLIARPGLLVMPGIYDALSARIVAANGFEAVAAGGYAAVGTMLGGPDIGQSNMRDYADHYARICGAVEMPVAVDADTGFGGVHNVRQMVRAFEAAGVSSLTIGDQVFPNRCGYLPGKQVVPVEQMIAKLKAALDARRDPDLVIVARTDAVNDHGLDQAIERCQLFMEAGVDVAKPQCVDRREDVARVVAEVPSPFIATLSQAAGTHRLDFAELEALGAAVVSLPSIALFAAARAVSDVMAKLRRDNALSGAADDLIPLEDYYGLVGLDREMAREESYHEAARHLVERRNGSSRTAMNRPPSGTAAHDDPRGEAARPPMPVEGRKQPSAGSV